MELLPEAPQADYVFYLQLKKKTLLYLLQTVILTSLK